MKLRESYHAVVIDDKTNKVLYEGSRDGCQPFIEGCKSVASGKFRNYEEFDKQASYFLGIKAAIANHEDFGENFV